MPTLFTLVSSVKRLITRTGIPSDDIRASNRFIADLIRKYNNKNIELRTDFGKDATLLEQVGVDLGCLSLCDVDPSECPTLLWGCKAKKVCDEVPKILSLPEFRGVLYLGIIDKGIFTGESFKYVNPANLQVKRKTASFGLFSFWTFIGGEYWVIPAKKYQDIEVIGMRIVAENPSEANPNINPDLDISGCETDYPMLSGGESEVIGFVLNELGFSMQLPDDEQNNARDDR